MHIVTGEKGLSGEETVDELREKKLWLFDLDGTVYNEGQLIDGAVDLLKSIKNNGGDYVFLTNNSSKSVEDYISKVNNMGIPAEKENFYTSTHVAIKYLREFFPNKKIYCQGTKSFVDELRKAGLDCTEKVEKVDVVIVGFDTELNSEKIRNTCEVLNQDVEYIATNPDLACPVSFGFIPDCGAICKLIKCATGKSPKFMGKPDAAMVLDLCHKFCRSTDETVVVGDRLYTDIAVGLNAGITSVAVLTGETSLKEIETGNIKPSYVFESVREINNCVFSV